MDSEPSGEAPVAAAADITGSAVEARGVRRLRREEEFVAVEEGVDKLVVGSAMTDPPVNSLLMIESTWSGM